MKSAIIIGLSIAALASAAAVLYYENQHRPIPQYQYAKIQLSNSKDEVKYRLGVPDDVIDDVCTVESFGCAYRMYIVDGSDPKNVIPEGKIFGDFNRWTYYQKLADGSRTGYVEIDFDQKTEKVSEISCFASEAETTAHNPFVCDIIAYSKSPEDSIAIGMTEEELKKKLGEPTSEELRADSPTKIIIYKNLNLEFSLTKQKIYRISVKMP